MNFSLLFSCYFCWASHSTPKFILCSNQQFLRWFGVSIISKTISSPHRLDVNVTLSFMFCHLLLTIFIPHKTFCVFFFWILSSSQSTRRCTIWHGCYHWLSHWSSSEVNIGNCQEMSRNAHIFGSSIAAWWPILMAVNLINFLISFHSINSHHRAIIYWVYNQGEFMFHFLL